MQKYYLIVDVISKKHLLHQTNSKIGSRFLLQILSQNSKLSVLNFKQKALQ